MVFSVARLLRVWPFGKYLALGLPSARSPVVQQCFDCNEKSQRTCKCCRGGFCLVHNEGSTHDKATIHPAVSKTPSNVYAV
jgi:hypothetical protein